MGTNSFNKKEKKSKVNMNFKLILKIFTGLQVFWK